MDQINPFTNAPANAQAPNQQVKPEQPKIKTPFSIKPILKIVLLIIIGVVVAKLAFDSLKPGLKPKPDTTSTAAKKTIKPVFQKDATDGKAKTGKSKTAQPVSLSETFAAAKQAVKKPASSSSNEPFTLNGIFLSESDGMSSAIINDKVVEVGETVDGASVESISIDGVELSKDGKTIKLQNR
jgi:type II secretory pathway component PulC